MNATMKTLILASAMLAVSSVSQAQTPLGEAAKLIENERFEQATAAIRTILSKEPTNGEAWFLLGENYFHNEKLDSANAAYKKGVEVNPLMPLNAVGLGKVFQATGKQVEAKAAFEAAIAKAIDKSSKTAKPMQASVYRESAEGLVYGPVKDPATALTYIEKAIVLDPAEPENYIVKGDALFEANPRDASEPMANFKKAADMKATSAKPVAKKGFVYYRAKNYDASISEYDKAASIDPLYAPTFRGRAEAWFMKRDFTKAKADYDNYLQLNKGNVSASVRYAQFLFLVQNYKESMDLIQKLEASGVDNNVLTRIKGYSMVELGDTVNAVPTLEAYFAKQPQDQVVSTDLKYYGRAVALMGNDSLAGEKLLAAAAMPNADPELFMEAGSFFQKAKMFNKAVVAYQGKTRSSKVAVNDWYYLGGAANKAKEFQVADDAWTQYIAKQPNVYQGYLGRARANVGLDPDKTTWQARPFFEDVIRKMKPEEMTKSLSDLEEAYFYLAFYNYYSTKDLPAAKCWFEKVKAVNAGTANTKVANDMLLSKELKDVKPAACELL